MRKILEDLIFIGSVEETYKLFGKEWTLKTLTSDEILTAASSTSEYDALARINAIKIAQLSRSVVKVDGLELKDVNEKIEFLGKMQQPLVDLLYSKYEELQKKQDESLKEMDSDIKN